MRLFKKFICLLILPMMAVTCLAGCGKDRTLDEVRQQFISYKENTNFNNLFHIENDIKTDKIEVSFDGEMANLGAIADFEKSSFGDDRLYERYYAIKYLQDAVLNNVFNYYSKYFASNDKDATSFYNRAKLMDVDKDEIKTLFKKMEDYKESLNTFETARQKLTYDVDILTFKGAISSSITSYCYEYNKFIEASFDLVNYAKDLNVKYLYSGEVNSANVNDYVSELKDRIVLQISELLFYRFSKAFDSVNSCDLADLNYNQFSKTDVISSVTVDDMLQGFLDTQQYSVIDYSAKINDTFSWDSITEESRVFDQRFKVFKVTYDNMSYYEYNQKLLTKSSNEKVYNEYINNLSNIEKANVGLVENFYEITFTDLVNMLTSKILSKK